MINISDIATYCDNLWILFIKDYNIIMLSELTTGVRHHMNEQEVEFDPEQEVEFDPVEFANFHDIQ